MEPKEYDIEFPRGDTCPVTFTLKDSEGNILIPTETDELYFTLKKSYNSSDFILQKKYSNNDFDVSNNKISFVLSHTDTGSLNYGNYVYDIQIKSGDYVKTVCIGTLTLTNESTWISNE